MNDESQHRITWIDMARGYGIILVIFGHLYDGPLKSWIYSFHLPLFFFLSGYLFKPHSSFIVFLKRKIKTLLIPYFFLGLVVIAFYTYITRAISIPGIIDIVISFVFQQKFINLWFITCLFILEIFFYFIVKYIKNDYAIVAISTVSLVLGYFYYKTINGLLYWIIDTCLMALPFCSLGYLVRKHSILPKLLSNPYKALLYCAIALLVSITFWRLSFVNGVSFNMFHNTYGQIHITYVAAIAGIFLIIVLSHYTNIGMVTYLGRNSMIYFILHQYVIFPIINYLLSINGFEQILYDNLFSVFSTHTFLLICIIKTVLTFIITTVLNEIILKSKIKFILGK